MKFVRPKLGGKTSRRQWLVPMLVGALVTGFFLMANVYKPTFLENISKLLTDVYQKQHPREYDPDTPVKVVDIDEESIRKIGQWPWPRTIMAEFNNRLANAGVAVVAYDVIFSEPDRTSPENILSIIENNPSATGDFSEFKSLKSHDEIFAESFGQTRVVTGMALLGFNDPNVTEPIIHASYVNLGASPATHLENYRGALHAIPILDEASEGAGSVSFQPDGDGIVRTAPVLGRVGDRLYPSLGVEALRVVQDSSTYVIKSGNWSGEWGLSSDEAPGMAWLRVGSYDVPTTYDGKVLVYYTKSEEARTIPAWKVLSDDPADRDWEDKLFGQIVFVGTSSEGLKDIVDTPIEGAVAGVLVHAQLVEQILQDEFLHRPYWIVVVEFFGILFLGALLTLLLPRLKAIRGVILILIIGNTIYWTSYLAFTRYNYLIDPVYPLLALVTCYVLITLASFYMTESERSRIRGAFALYLSPEMVKQVSEDPGLLKLGGEEKEITIFFLDIRSFSRISETMRPQDITNFLNKFLTPMTDILQSYEATIDKYIGDAIVAFWNAPIDDPEHEKNAARAVLDMQSKLAELNAKYRNQNDFRWPDQVDMGIGLNTGICCVGNLGSEQRFSYSMIGDAANLASRIEGLTKQYRISTLIGSATAEALTGFATLEADIVSVVGREAPERIYMIAGDEDLATQTAFHQFKEVHAQFLEAYRNCQWDEATTLVSSLITMSGPYDLHGYYKTMRERISDYMKTPPPKDWEGIFHADSK